MKKSCKDAVDPCEDFLETVVTAYILEAIMGVLGMSTMEDEPCHWSELFPQDITIDESSCSSFIMDIASLVVNQYVDLNVQFNQNSKTKCTGTALAYTKEVISLGLLYFNFQDAVNENDGLRIFNVYKFLLPLFKASNRNNYSIKILNFLVQHKFLLSPCLAEQLMWSRCVNTHGLPRRNISCDLHMEYLNRVAKMAIRGLGANKMAKSVTRLESL